MFQSQAITNISKEIDFENLFRATPGLYLVLKPDFTIVAVSDAYLQATKTQRENIQDKGIFEVFPDNPNDLQATGVSNLRYSLNQVLATGAEHTMAVQKYDIQRPISEGGGFIERYWSPINKPVFNAKNELVYIIHRVEDVTEFVKSQQQSQQEAAKAETYRMQVNKMESDILQRTQEIQQANNRMQGIINATSDLIAAIDNNFCFTSFNHAYRKEFEALFGKRVSIGMNILEALADFPDEQAKAQKNWSRALMGEGFTIVEEFGNVSHRRYQEMNYNAIYNENQQPIGACQIGRDITERKQMELSLKKAKEEAEAANALKTQFFSNISHEFRTPLTLMLGPLEDILTDESNPINQHQRNLLLLIQNNASRLLKLVNSLLDFSRLEANRVQPVYESTNLTNFTADLCSVFRSAIEKAGLQFKVDMPTSLDVEVYLDKEMWEKIIFNLLSNALKFTLEGGISVSMQKQRDYVQLIVEDTGVGIPAHELPHIFERFHRVEGSQGRSFEGTGIGLALVYELVKLHGGGIHAESHPGHGSKFIIDIPLGYAHLSKERVGIKSESYQMGMVGHAYVKEALGWLPESPPITLEQAVLVNAEPVMEVSPRKSVSHKQARILLVDDNLDMLSYVKTILSPYYEVDTADNGKTALAAIAIHSPDLVLSDVMMPVMDGYQLLKELRANSQTQHIPVILLSARAGEEARVEGLQAGADDYLAKPFSSKELLARLHIHLELSHLRLQLEALVQQRTEQLEKTHELLQQEMQARHHAQLAAESARAEAAEAYRRQLEALIDSICHEIRNPLNGIYGNIDAIRVIIQALKTAFSQNVLQAQLSEHLLKLEEAVVTLEECAKYQHTIVNDVLDLHKLETGFVEIQQQIFKPKEVIQSVIKIFTPEIAKRQLILVLHLPEEEILVKGDAEHLKQVLVNFVSNAVKFTTKGQIIIRMKVQSTDKEDIILQFEVADTGIGIPEDVQAKLFNRFFQGHYNVGQKYGGSGLGLAISKKLITLMGGEINFTSQSGSGTTFYFTIRCLPLSLQEREAQQKIEQTPLPMLANTDIPSKYILIVEDNIPNQKILGNYLTHAGHRFEIANHGQEAVEWTKKANFDLIFMDLKMPIMDGLEATRLIRQYEVEHSLPLAPIIGLSADAQPKDKQAALAQGMNDYITKPYRKEQIYRMIEKWTMGAFSQQKLSAHEVTTNTSTTRKVLRDLNSSQSSKELPQALVLATTSNTFLSSATSTQISHASSSSSPVSQTTTEEAMDTKDDADLPHPSFKETLKRKRL